MYSEWVPQQGKKRGKHHSPSKKTNKETKKKLRALTPRNKNPFSESYLCQGYIG